ncbi:MAG: C40 family peptidase [Bacteroidales bacterium]
MTFGINLLSIIAVREAPSHKSEMVNQLLFGEVFQVEVIKGDWAYIASSHDNYKGWIDKKQMVGIGEQEYERMRGDDISVCTDIAQIVHNKSANDLISVVAGSSLPVPEKDNAFSMAGREFSYEGMRADLVNVQMPSQLAQIAEMFKGVPYLWGGRSPFGLDCSGFTQLVFKIGGFKIARDASDQAGEGDLVDFFEHAQAGDLCFFDNEQGDITHVGVYMGNDHIIHAHGKVRIDRVDHQGIYSKDDRRYSHHLRLIKRLHS